jgi:sigma-B regulation protein RsbU (phosphoserine phosphatase)
MSGRRILLVDDSKTIRTMISSLLEDEGYAVTTAVDGEKGYEQAKADPPELILTDFEMPVLDGPGLCRKLKEDLQLRGIPVVMLTTLGAIESKLTGLDAGADDYIEKPQSPDDLQELFARIRAQLRIGDLRRELAERNAELEAAQAKLLFELELARKVQLGLMPSAPKPRGACQFAVRYRPANALGGDVYDFLRREDGRLSVMVVDVSGHGVNAAMLSGVVKTMANPLATTEAKPSEALAKLDAALSQYFPEGFFCTAALVFLDEQSGKFEMASVGHPPVLIVRKDGAVDKIDPDAGLLGIGFMEPEMIQMHSGEIEPGDTMLIYTDGLPDAMAGGDGEPFSDAQISAILAADPKRAPGMVIEEMEQAIVRHTSPGQPHDDINMVAIRHEPGGGA